MSGALPRVAVLALGGTIASAGASLGDVRAAFDALGAPGDESASAVGGALVLSPSGRS